MSLVLLVFLDKENCDGGAQKGNPGGDSANNRKVVVATKRFILEIVVLENTVRQRKSYVKGLADYGHVTYVPKSLTPKKCFKHKGSEKNFPCSCPAVDRRQLVP